MAKKKSEKTEKPKKGKKAKSQVETPPVDDGLSGGSPAADGFLIDVHPENAKEILRVAKEYKAAQRQRMKFGEEEAASKAKLLELVKAAKFQPSNDGSIKFSIDGVKISVTPRDELIKVNCDKDEAEAA